MNKQKIESPASRLANDAEYIELVIKRAAMADNYPGHVVLQLVVVKYMATYAVYTLEGL